MLFDSSSFYWYCLVIVVGVVLLLMFFFLLFHLVRVMSHTISILYVLYIFLFYLWFVCSLFFLICCFLFYFCSTIRCSCDKNSMMLNIFSNKNVHNINWTRHEFLIGWAEMLQSGPFISIVMWCDVQKVTPTKETKGEK